MRSLNRQILPSTKDKYLDLPNMDGSYLFNGKLNDRMIDVEFSMKQTALYEIRSKSRAIANWLRTSERKILIFDDEPDVWYMAKVSNQLDLQPLINSGRFNVTFRCLPYAFGPSDTYDETYLYDTGLQYDTGLIYPNPTGFYWQYPEQRSSLYNYSLETDLIITITGTVSGPSILHETSGKQLYLPPINEGTIVINTKDYTVKKDGANALAQKGGEFFKLAAGGNSFVFQCGSASADVSYAWEHKYL